MLIAGAGNLGKHCLDMLVYDQYQGQIVFYDDQQDSESSIYDSYPILKTEEEVRRHFAENGKDFLAAVGNNRQRAKMTEKIEAWGGQLVSLISSKSYISALLEIKSPIIVQPGVSIAHNIQFGKSCTIHANSVIGHDVVMGDYVSIASLSTIIGPCSIGSFTFIGTNVVIHPHLKIGRNAYIGSGVVVRKDIPDYGTLDYLGGE